MASSANTHGQGVDAPQRHVGTNNTTHSDSDNAIVLYHAHTLDCTPENCAGWGTPAHTETLMAKLDNWWTLPREELHLVLHRFGALRPYLDVSYETAAMTVPPLVVSVK